MRAVLTRLSVAVLAVGVTAIAAPVGAFAAHEPTEPIIVFDGSVTVNSTEGDVYVLSASLTVDCTTEPCTALTSSSDGTYTPPLTNDQALPLINGAVAVSLPEYGDLCALRWIGAGDLSITASATTATVSRGSAAGAPRPCPDGATGEAAGATISGTLAYRSGTVCLIDDSCVEPVASSSPTPTPRPTVTREPTIGELIEWPVAASAMSTLATPQSALTVPNAAWAVTTAVVLVLLISFPSVLLDSATDRIATWLDDRRTRRAGRPRTPADPPPLTLVGLPFALVGLLIAALASAYVDPDFGFDLVGARLVISVVASFLATVALGWGFVSLVMAIGFPRSRPRIEFRPLTLLVVAAAVVFSRLTGFEPGIIFGLIAGVGFATVLASRVRSFASIVGILYLFVAATLGWVGYGFVSETVGENQEWGELLARETLAAIAIAGASALPIALLPLRGLTGHAVWQWNRWVWALLYLLAAAGFVFALMPLPDSWQEVGVEYWSWLGAYVAYSLVALLIWLVVRPWRPTTADSKEADASGAD